MWFGKGYVRFKFELVCIFLFGIVVLRIYNLVGIYFGLSGLNMMDCSYIVLRGICMRVVEVIFDVFV